MLGLPKATELNKQLSKKMIFQKFKLNAASRKLFDDQISRLAIVAEVSPQSVSNRRITYAVKQLERIAFNGYYNCWKCITKVIRYSFLCTRVFGLTCYSQNCY